MNIIDEVKVQSVPGKVCGLVYLAPAQAAQIMADQSNPNNRKIIKSVLARYIKDMERGEFAETTMLSFDKNGMLLDGHHRLTALSKSKCDGQWFVMLYGAKNDRFIFDRGSQRTTAQTMNMDKISVNSQDVAIARMVIDVMEAYVNDHERKNTTTFCITDTEVQDFIIENSQIMKKLRNTVSKNGAMTRKAPVSAAIFQALKSGVSEEVLSRFAKVLNEGYQNNDAESAAVTLGKQLGKKYGSGRQDRLMYEKATEEAIACFVLGKPRRREFEGKSYPYTSLVSKK